MSQDFYPNNAFGYALLGAALISICLYYTIKGIQDVEDFNNSIPHKFKLGKFVLFNIMLLSFIVFIAITIKLTYLYSSIKEIELKQFGKITTGEITQGYSLTSKNDPGTYTVTIEYNREDGKTIKAITRVSPTEFQEYYVGKEVNIIYSTHNNALVDLLTDDEKIKNYTKIENKDITIDNLLKLLEIKQSEFGTFLNKISYSWQFDSTKKSWINNQKDILITINDDKSISYLTAIVSPEKINSEINLLKFKRINIANNLSKTQKIEMQLFSADGLYENENFGLLIKTMPMGKEGQMATVINVFKK